MTKIPEKTAILDWISANPTLTAKRDIAKVFGIKGANRIDLKRILKVTPQTVNTYMRNIRRLAKIAGLDSIPAGKGWLSGKKGSALVKVVGSLPNNVARHLYLAGNTAYRVYSDDKDRSTLWRSKTVESSNKYRDHRAKQQKSPDEEKNWATTKRPQPF